MAASVLGVTACSSSGAAAEAAAPTEPTAAAECFLGLDLWDTDPALTWIEDGRVWVRAGDHQACLAFSDASDLWWSPDGRRLFLDDEIVAGDGLVAAPDVAAATQLVWQQPAGEALHVVDADGTTRLLEFGSTAATSPLRLPGTILLASHRHGEQGQCAAATSTSTLFMDGAVASDGIPGAAVGFFRGRGLPVLATSSAGDGCGQGQLWVTSGLPITGSAVLVADQVLAADIRDEAPDPRNPNTAPPFA